MESVDEGQALLITTNSGGTHVGIESKQQQMVNAQPIF